MGDESLLDEALVAKDSMDSFFDELLTPGSNNLLPSLQSPHAAASEAIKMQQLFCDMNYMPMQAAVAPQAAPPQPESHKRPRVCTMQPAVSPDPPPTLELPPPAAADAKMHREAVKLPVQRRGFKPYVRDEYALRLLTQAVSLATCSKAVVPLQCAGYGYTHPPTSDEHGRRPFAVVSASYNERFPDNPIFFKPFSISSSFKYSMACYGFNFIVVPKMTENTPPVYVVTAESLIAMLSLPKQPMHFEITHPGVPCDGVALALAKPRPNSAASSVATRNFMQQNDDELCKKINQYREPLYAPAVVPRNHCFCESCIYAHDTARNYVGDATALSYLKRSGRHFDLFGTRILEEDRMRAIGELLQQCVSTRFFDKNIRREQGLFNSPIAFINAVNARSMQLIRIMVVPSTAMLVSEVQLERTTAFCNTLHCDITSTFTPHSFDTITLENGMQRKFIKERHCFVCNKPALPTDDTSAFPAMYKDFVHKDCMLECMECGSLSVPKIPLIVHMATVNGAFMCHFCQNRKQRADITLRKRNGEAKKKNVQKASQILVNAEVVQKDPKRAACV